MAAFRVGKKSIDVIGVVQSLSAARQCKTHPILHMTLIDGSTIGQLAIFKIAVFGAELIAFLKDKIGKPVALFGVLVEADPSAISMTIYSLGTVTVAPPCQKTNTFDDNGGEIFVGRRHTMPDHRVGPNCRHGLAW